ncbi:BrnT family toxin [uncultured Thiohalocapsa sp.]|uniref:BrnT family toxin n=1 Tax=uncultured Thiohalocapsa sp. TaxID=768990 RepID=UPI00345DE1FE
MGPRQSEAEFRKAGGCVRRGGDGLQGPALHRLLRSGTRHDEHRSTRVGCSNRNRVLVVANSERDEQTRIISARPATKHERQAYEED